MAKDTSQAMVEKSYFYWRGGLAIITGVLILIWPHLTVVNLFLLLSIWLLLAGVVTIVEGIGAIKHNGYDWLLTIFVGLFLLSSGAYIVQHPAFKLSGLITLLGIVFIVQGVVHTFNAFIDTAVSNESRMLSLVYAVVAVVAGIWLIRYPYHGTLAFLWLIGLYAIASGAMQIAMGNENTNI